MSNTSTTTTLATCDHTLGNDPDLLNPICVLTIARGDGTVFHTDSLQGKDVVELCVGMGQAHPNSVLQLSVMELVIAFHSSEEMLATACLITTATVWHNDPIRPHIQPHTTAQI